MSTLRDIGEDALIERITALVPREDQPGAGPGDDCAVIDSGSGQLLLLKTDALVEGIHYLPDADAQAVGWKAAARVVSDFAAMGGQAERFLITLALPSNTEVSWVEGLYRGMGRCLEQFGAVVAGGETSSVPDDSAKVISIAATGSVAKERLVLRSAGKAGDHLFVTGRLGGSIHGKHLDFTPRVREANWLAAHCKPSAMMDLSDGLAKDLPRLAKASGCGFVIDEKAVPVTRGCTVEHALGDGEDFELLFAIDRAKVPGLLATWPFADVPLAEIGELVEAGEGVGLKGGWEHFRQAGDQR